MQWGSRDWALDSGRGLMTKVKQRRLVAPMGWVTIAIGTGFCETYMQWPPSVRCPSMAQTLGIAIQCRWESWLWKPGWPGQVKQVGHGCITMPSCKKFPSCGLSRSNWFPSPRLGNAWTTHGRWSPHVGLAASCLPWTVTHPSTNQARRCLTWSFGAWYALNLNITS